MKPNNATRRRGASKKETIAGIAGMLATGTAAVGWLAVAAPAWLVILWAEHGQGAEPMPEDTIKPTIKENPHICSAGGACVFSVSQGLKFGTCRCFAGDCRIELARARRAAFWLRERYLDLRAEGAER